MSEDLENRSYDANTVVANGAETYATAEENEQSRILKDCAKLGYSFETIARAVEDCVLEGFGRSTWNDITYYIDVIEGKRGKVPKYLFEACLEYLIVDECIIEVKPVEGKRTFVPTWGSRFTCTGLKLLVSDPEIPVGIRCHYK